MVSALQSNLGFSFGEALYPNGGLYGPLTSPYATLLLIHQGRAEIGCDGARHLLGAGEIGCYVNARDISILYPAGLSTRVAWCETRLAALPAGPGSIGLPSAASLPLGERIAGLMRTGLDLGYAEEPALNRLRNALGEAVFAAFALDLGLGGTGAPNAAVQRARAYAERFYSGACDLADLARAAGVTPEHLVTAFRRQLGRTPMRYVWELRTAKAINLVQRSGLTLAEIADQCGYKSPFHLSREIKKTTGLAPRDLRRKGGYLPSTVEAGLAPARHF